LFCYYVHCAILPAKAVPEITYTVSVGTLNPTHSLTPYLQQFRRNSLLKSALQPKNCKKIH